MTVLGEAFIRVRADTKPFIADLEREVKRAADNAEKSLRAAITQGLSGGASDSDIGRRVADDIESGITKKFSKGNKSPFVLLVASLGAALDDGLSALPAEVKAAIVVGILAAAPLIAGAIAGAITAGIGVGLAGIGTLIAFQFKEVEEAGGVLADNLQVLMLNAASAFGPAVIKAIGLIQTRFQQFAQTLNRIFTRAAEYVVPLTQGILNFVDMVISAIDDSGGEIGKFVDELAKGLGTLGYAVGDVIRTLAGTGEEGREAFRDMILVISLMLRNTADLLAFLTEVYGVLRDITLVINPVLGWLISASDDAADATKNLAGANQLLAPAMRLTAQRTEEQEREFRDLDKAIDGATKAVYGLIQGQIDFERSLDNIREALKENGATFDITNEKGRRNVEEFLAGLRAAEQEALDYTATGKMSAEQAAQFYDQQIAKLRQLATGANITGAQFDTMFGQIISVAQLKLDANAMGLTATERELQDAVKRARELYEQLEAIARFRLPSGGTRRFSEYAEGGIVTHPTQALIGEAGAEVVIPLTKPARAAQLMQQSGLTAMFSPQSPVVNVFIGNEQLDSRTVRIVEEANSALGTSLAFGPRGL